MYVAEDGKDLRLDHRRVQAIRGKPPFGEELTAEIGVVIDGEPALPAVSVISRRRPVPGERHEERDRLSVGWRQAESEDGSPWMSAWDRCRGTRSDSVADPSALDSTREHQVYTSLETIAEVAPLRLLRDTYAKTRGDHVRTSAPCAIDRVAYSSVRIAGLDSVEKFDQHV